MIVCLVELCVKCIMVHPISLILWLYYNIRCRRRVSGQACASSQKTPTTVSVVTIFFHFFCKLVYFDYCLLLPITVPVHRLYY